MDEILLRKLEARLGSKLARLRLKFEADHQAQLFGEGLTFFHMENWYSASSIIRKALKLCGLYWRARRNADNVTLKRNDIACRNLPPAFEGFTILQISDLHVELSADAMERVFDIVKSLHADICVLTGDYRGKTYGPFEQAMKYVARMRSQISAPVYAVLGNHDSIQMVPALEEMDIRVLLNECEAITREDQRIHLAGIDDAHFYRADDIETSALDIPQGEFSILLSHTPEVYRQAAKAGFDLMFSGHTHGGQLCLPGGIAVKLEAVIPRKFGAGGWVHQDLIGYTSVGAGTSILPVRLNCPPEVTLHALRRG